MTSSTDLVPSPSPECGAKLRGRDAYCRQPAGCRTNHPGTGKCWLHGGLTPVRHGRYSKVVRTEIQELMAEMEADPDPLNILPELLMVRSLMADFINRYEENRDAMLAWYASWNGRPWRIQDLELLRTVVDEYMGRLKEEGLEQDDPLWQDAVRADLMLMSMSEAYTTRPREVLDIADAYHMASEATKIVERIEKIRARGAVSLQDFNRVMTEIGRTVEAGLSPAKVRQVLSAAGVEVMGEAELIQISDNLRNTLIDLILTIHVK